MDTLIYDFFQRFKTDVTQSMYSMKGINDYNKLKKYYDYLDYDEKTIIRDKTQSQSVGLRNIGNTCYFNVFLQVLYHINILREKIFSANDQKSRVLQQIKLLFGKMQVGKLAYADPTNLFQQLKKAHPNVFIQGVQNDFHQICTILLDQLKDCLKLSPQNDRKLIDKMLFGKLTIKTSHSEGYTTRNTKFNIINLDSSHDSLENALQKWKNYEIQDFLTDNNKTVKATVETDFIETPALMTFFINRVSFKENKLVKDNREFKFQNQIYLSKNTLTSKSSIQKLSKGFSKKQVQLQQQKQRLTQWIQKISAQKEHLSYSLKYLQQKQFSPIFLPQIQNSFQQKCFPKQYLQQEIKLIDQKIQQTKKQIIIIQEKIHKLLQDTQNQLYLLWGMMIHQGNNPAYGHYKVLLNTHHNTWVQFNDRKVLLVNLDKIQQYKRKGQICCLFYRRPTLVCTDTKAIIPVSLKSKVTQIQKQIMGQVDKSRVLQNLYQLTQSSNYLLQSQQRLFPQNKYLFFLKPILYCLQSKSPIPQCLSILIYNQLCLDSNKNKLLSQFLIQTELNVPYMRLDIPQEYYIAVKVWKEFFRMEIMQANQVETAFQYLATNSKIKFKTKILEKWNQTYLQYAIMKAAFYLCVYYRLTLTQQVKLKFIQLFNAVESLINKLNPVSDFTLTYIAIKDQISRLFAVKSKNAQAGPTKVLKITANTIISKLMQQNECQLFKLRFGYWIAQRSNLSKIDQQIIYQQVKLHNEYIMQSQ